MSNDIRDKIIQFATMRQVTGSEKITGKTKLKDIKFSASTGGKNAFREDILETYAPVFPDSGIDSFVTMDDLVQYVDENRAL